MGQCHGAVETSGPAVRALKPWPDPARYEKTILRFEADTTAPQDAIIGYGSSSMGGWHKTIQEDLKPFTIVRRGFGGSNMNDALHFMDRVIVPLKPRAVLLYEGDNDVSAGQPTEEIVAKYREFLKRLHAALPATRTYIISIKPSISRWRLWPEMKEANDELKILAASDPLVTYIDVATPMLNEKGEPREDIFLADKLHMNRRGYELWRDAVLPVLLQHETQDAAVK